MSTVKLQGNSGGSGSVTLVSPNISTDITVTLPNTSSTLGGVPSTAGAVGTYMFAVVVSSFNNESAGATRAGSTLREANAWNASNGTTVGYNNNALSGTWQCMGDTLSYNGSSTTANAKYLSQTLWLRLS